MSARIPPGFADIIHHFTCPGQSGDVITTMGVSGTDLNDPANHSTYAVAASELMGNLNNAVDMVSLDFVIGQDGPDDEVISFAMSASGLASGAMTPVNSAFLLQKRTGFGGRRNRGRMYLPGVSEGAVGDDGTVDFGVSGGISTNVDSWEAGLPGDWAFVLLHQVAPFTPSLITTINVGTKIASQRGRLRD